VCAKKVLAHLEGPCLDEVSRRFAPRSQQPSAGDVDRDRRFSECEGAAPRLSFVGSEGPSPSFQAQRQQHQHQHHQHHQHQHQQAALAAAWDGGVAASVPATAPAVASAAVASAAVASAAVAAPLRPPRAEALDHAGPSRAALAPGFLLQGSGPSGVSFEGGGGSASGAGGHGEAQAADPSAAAYHAGGWPEGRPFADHPAPRSSGTSATAEAAGTVVNPDVQASFAQPPFAQVPFARRPVQFVETRPRDTRPASMQIDLV